MKQQPTGLPVSSSQIAAETRQDIHSVKASCKALTEEKKLERVSQTLVGDASNEGVFVGGDLYQTEQWYRLPRQRGGANRGQGRKKSDRQLTKVTIRVFADQLPITDAEIREAIDSYLSSRRG